MQTAPAFEDDENDDEEMQVLAVASTEYNEIVVLRIPEKTDHPYAGAKVLILDLTGKTVKTQLFPIPFLVVSVLPSLFQSLSCLRFRLKMDPSELKAAYC